MNEIIKTRGLTKIFGSAKNPVYAIKDIDLSIPEGSFTVILGRSGSGKSTLLNLLAGLDKASKGLVEVQGKNLSDLKSSQLAKYRSTIGIIFQFYNLLPNLNALENIMMGAWAGGDTVEEEKAIELMRKFGLEHRVKADVKTLSGGEKQRVAICRSLVSDPKILFCDEPTGALDSVNEKQVMDIISDLHKNGLTIVMVTHNPEFANLANKIIKMKDGNIEEIINK